MPYKFVPYFTNLGKEKPTIGDIQNHVVSCWALKWRDLGTELNIDLEIFEHGHPNNSKGCCIEVFSKWLDINLTAC